MVLSQTTAAVLALRGSSLEDCVLLGDEERRALEVDEPRLVLGQRLVGPATPVGTPTPTTAGFPRHALKCLGAVECLEARDHLSRTRLRPSAQGIAPRSDLGSLRFALDR